MFKSNKDEYLAVGGDQLAKDVEQMVVMAAAGERGQAELNSDEELSNVLHERNFARMGGHSYGRIVYSMPYAHWYRVFIDDLNGDAACCALTDCSSIPVGVRGTSPLPIGQPVLIWWPPEGLYGFIIGACPPKIEDGALVHPDWISQGSNVGFKREAYYLELFDLTNDDGGATDWSNNRPLDALGMGEWGRITDLGAGVHVDPFMTFLRADETAGLWLFYMDRLARLCGHNFDLRTAMAEMIVRDDSGEGGHFSGFSPYAWEGMGAFEFGTKTHREISDDDVHYKKPYGKYEPLEDKQQAFYRFEEYRGYLGQAFMRHVMAPPIGASGVNTYDSERNRVGLFREQISLDGAYALESAHSITIVKRALIPIPKRLKLHEEPEGDTLNNGDDDEGTDYKFAGMHGKGEEHKVASIKANSDKPHLQEVAALSDFVAHAFEWKGLHPFHYHKNDFKTPEQEDLTPMSSIQEVPSYGSLGGTQWLPPPTPGKSVKIDHRYSDTDYYETTCGLHLLPRGGVALRGGGTEEIRMVGGSIQMSAPGDVWLQPGRNVNIFAADDCIIKVHKSCDITATKNDVRIKAQRNMQIIGGNEETGGVLIESRTPSPQYNFDKAGEDTQHGGILLKTDKGEIVNWGKNIYLRTGGGTVEEGQITLDASKGNQDIRTVCRAKLNHINLVKSDAFPTGDGKVVANNYSAGNAQIHTPLQCDGHLVLTKNGLLMKGYIAVVAGHIGTEYAPQYFFLVGWLTGQPLSQAKASIAQTLASMEKFKKDMGKDWKKGIDEFWYDDMRPGNDQVMTDGKFGLRTDLQMNTKEWELPETYWMQTARLTDQSLQPWEEKDVDGPEGKQKPYPGKDKWEGDSLRTVDLKLHKPKEGRDERRDSGLYESPELADLEKSKPEEKYPIIVS